MFFSEMNNPFSKLFARERFGISSVLGRQPEGPSEKRLGLLSLLTQKKTLPGPVNHLVGGSSPPRGAKFQKPVVGLREVA